MVDVLVQESPSCVFVDHCCAAHVALKACSRAAADAGACTAVDSHFSGECGSCETHVTLLKWFAPTVAANALAYSPVPDSVA